MKTIEKIDPTSDRYRICKCDCGEPFMAHHRSMLFKNDQHADEFHNRQKRLKEEEKLKNAMKPVVALPAPVQEKPPPEWAPPEVPYSKTEEPIDKGKADLKFLNSLQIDSENGSSFNMDWMHSQGYDFGVFAGQGKLHNIDPANNCRFMQIGPYRLFRVEYSTVLIKKII